VRRLYRDALALRREHLVPEPAAGRACVARALDAHTLVVEGPGSRGTPYACICQLRGAETVRYLPPPAFEWTRWRLALSTEEPAYVADARPIGIAQCGAGVELTIARPGAVLLLGRAEDGAGSGSGRGDMRHGRGLTTRPGPP
jgi:Domain of unknown function (DUF3459)